MEEEVLGPVERSHLTGRQGRLKAWPSSFVLPYYGAMKGLMKVNWMMRQRRRSLNPASGTHEEHILIQLQSIQTIESYLYISNSRHRVKSIRHCRHLFLCSNGIPKIYRPIHHRTKMLFIVLIGN